jgi:hypothetical protein
MLVDVKYNSSTYKMAEPLTLLAGLNFLKSLDVHPLLYYFADLLFGDSISASEKGKQLELLYVLRCLQHWWKDIDLFKNIPAPTGVVDARVGSNMEESFIIILLRTNVSNMLLPPVNAGPDVVYQNIFGHFKTTWTGRFITNTVSRNNQRNTDYKNWFSKQKSVGKNVKTIVRSNGLASKMIHLVIELPYSKAKVDTTGPYGSTRLLIDLNHPLAVHIFSEFFVEKYKSYVEKYL